MKTLRRLRYLFQQRRMERELEEEIAFHREMNGDPREIGNITLAREEARAVWIWPWLQSIWQDTAYAMRNLRRQPGFALLGLAALGAAIGINTSLVSVFNAIAIRPWPVKDPARVVKIFAVDPRHLADGVSVAEYRYMAAHSRAFAGFASMWNAPVHFGFEAFGESSNASFVSAGYFRLLGVGMQLGRGFLPEEDQLQSPQAVAVLSYPYWRDHFGSDIDIAGKQVQMDEIPFTVLGVTAQDFTGTSEGGGRQDIYLPLPALLLLHPAESWPRDLLTKPDSCCTFVFGRLNPGVSRAQAAAELEVLDRQFPSSKSTTTRAFILTSSAMFDTPVRKGQIGLVFGLMFAGAMVILLLACANVGSLLIARAEARRKEIEIRRAIGAGRARIIRQLMTESMLLALGATGLGVVLAFKLPRFVINQTGELMGVPLIPDATVLGYAAGLAVFTCIAFGLAPALYGTRTTGPRLPLRNVLLAVQVALSVVLLLGAALMLRGVASLRSSDPGFAIDGVSVISFELPARSYDNSHMQAFNRQLAGAMHSGRIGFTLWEPLGHTFAEVDFRPSGTPENTANVVDYQVVSDGYFDVLRIPIIAGRSFMRGDEGRGVALVNETLAHRYWNDQIPLGKTIVSKNVTREIVGVVKDSHTDTLDQIGPVLYAPFDGLGIPKILVDSGDASTIELVRMAARQIEPRARTQVKPLRDNLDRWLGGARVGAEIAGGLGLFALILATVGISGVFAYVVQHRTKEIGIRMALGAKPKQVIRLVLGASSRAVAVGSVVGFAIALPAARLMGNVVYDISPLDPMAYLSVALILGIAGLAASYAPARRAARVDPLSALRHD